MAQQGGRRKGAGRTPGAKNKKTLLLEAEREVYQQLVLENLRPIFRKQLLLAMGQIYIYRKERHGTGASMRIEHVLLERPQEIADALDVIANEDLQEDDGTFVYVSVKQPDNGAIKDMLDRSIGRPKQTIAGDKDNPLEVVNIIKYAKPQGK